MEPPSEPVLSVRGLSVRRGAATILRDLAWDVRAGEHWVVLGANGSGKTSLLSAITGYLTPSTGEVEVLGARYGQSDWRELRQRVGLVSSSLRQLMPDAATALEIVLGGFAASIGLPGPATPGRVRAARAALRAAEAAGIARRPWAVLSQGERQKVLIARALVGQPAVIMLDEPCAGLDPVAREHFLAAMQRLAQRGLTTLVLITHHIEEITVAFTHALVLQAGRVLAAGPLDRVLRSPILSDAFGAPLRVRRVAARWILEPVREKGV